MNDIFKYESYKLCEILQMKIANDIHQNSHFMSDIMNDNCEWHHSQIPVVLEYSEWQVYHNPMVYLFSLEKRGWEGECLTTSKQIAVS